MDVYYIPPYRSQKYVLGQETSALYALLELNICPSHINRHSRGRSSGPMDYHRFQEFYKDVRKYYYEYNIVH